MDNVTVQLTPDECEFATEYLEDVVDSIADPVVKAAIISVIKELTK